MKTTSACSRSRRNHPELLRPSPLISDELGFEIDPDVSIGLRYQGKLIGWMITRRLTEDAAVLSLLYLRRNSNKQAKASFYTQNPLSVCGGYTQGMFSIYADKTELFTLFTEDVKGVYPVKPKSNILSSKQI